MPDSRLGRSDPWQEGARNVRWMLTAWAVVLVAILVLVAVGVRF